MGKKSLAAYKYTRDVDEAAKFLERFRHQEGIQIEIIIKGDIGDFFSLSPKVDVSIDNVTCYRFDFACHTFITSEQGHDVGTSFYLAYWEQVAFTHSRTFLYRGLRQREKSAHAGETRLSCFVRLLRISARLRLHSEHNYGRTF